MAEQLFQVGIKAIIRNEKGEVLLQAFEHGGVIELWDLPGGRMDEGENFMQTLIRELKEEIDVDYSGEPKHVMTMLSNVKMKAGELEVPLILLAYEVELLADAIPKAAETDSVVEWVTPVEAAERLIRKFSPEFCEMIAQL